MEIQDIVNEESVKQLTKSMKYLAYRTNSIIPYVPVHTKEEKLLFMKSIAKYNYDFGRMAVDWNNGTIFLASKSLPDGTTIFRKHPEHLKRHLKSFLKSSLARNAYRFNEKNIRNLDEYLESYGVGSTAFLDPAQSVGIYSLDFEDRIAKISEDLMSGKWESLSQLNIYSENYTVRVNSDMNYHSGFVYQEKTKRKLPEASESLFSKTRKLRTCQVTGCKDSLHCPGKNNRLKCLSREVNQTKATIVKINSTFDSYLSLLNDSRLDFSLYETDPVLSFNHPQRRVLQVPCNRSGPVLLNENQKMQLDNYLHGFVSFLNCPIEKSSLDTLNPGNWIDDEVRIFATRTKLRLLIGIAFKLPNDQ